MDTYYIVFNPATYDLMSLDRDTCASPLDLIRYLTNLDASRLGQENYLSYLHFDAAKRRVGMVEAFAIENGAAGYIGNQIAQLVPEAAVIHADDIRVTLHEAIVRQRKKPDAVFMTSISSNFPAAVSAAIILNQAKIPVIIGGIHVSTAPKDVELFIRRHCPHPELVAQVTGPGDSVVFAQVLHDLGQGSLKGEYLGHITIEDGVWRTPSNVQPLPPMNMHVRGKVPLLGSFLHNKIRMNSVAPYLGCPYSCSFCSISTLPPHQRRLTMRRADDFLEELAQYQKQDTCVQFPIFLFNTDNLLMGGKVLEEILDGIIERKMKIPFMAQISIEVASNEKLLERLRLAGALLFEVGFESLDLRNLECIGKHAVLEIRKSGLTAPEYYARQIRKILDHGIAIQGSFIFGLPYDRFDSLDSNTGTDVAQFCLDNHISLMAGCFSVMPGARAFQESLEAGSWMYGGPGTMDYLRALCLADHGEMNLYPNEGVSKSPLLVGVMAMQALRRVGDAGNAFRSALHMWRKAFAFPTMRGQESYKDRIESSLLAGATHLMTASMYKDHGQRLATSRPGIRGGLERLYDMEMDPEIKSLCKDYVARFIKDDTMPIIQQENDPKGLFGARRVCAAGSGGKYN
jgi:hypothetical protein